MRVTDAFVGAKGVDTIQMLSETNCKFLKSQGIDFVVRYINLLSTTEIDTILSSGLALQIVTFAKQYDAFEVVKKLQKLGIPREATIYLDLEDESGPSNVLINKINKFGRFISSSGYTAGLYYGAGLVLNSAELWMLEVTRYWESCSRELDALGHPSIPQCGPCMVQLYPPNQKLGDITVDYDFIQKDFRNRLPTWIVNG
jgi:hypothetical protein